jgi:hypothetical protein
MAILTHKIMCTNPKDSKQFCIGVYDTFEIAVKTKERNELCFPRCTFEIVENN